MRQRRIPCRALPALAALLLAVSALPGLAFAQTSHVAEIAAYQGADREQRLIEGAKREKELTFYGSIPTDDITVLVAAFDKKYGVKVKVWRADSEGFLQRIVGEARARRYEVDIMAGSTSALEPLYRENLLQEVKSPNLADIIPEAIAPHRQWAAIYLNTIVQAYNTNLIRKDDLPRSFHDLVRLEWKGKLGIEAEDYDWLATLVPELGGEAEGLKLFRDIVATNGVSVRRGHTLLTNLAVAGEVPFALTVYSFTAEQLKRKGAPIDWFILGPAIARPNGVGVTRTTQHPNAAVLFFDFLISDGQAIFAERNFVPTSKKFDTPFKSSLKVVDTARMLDEGKPWQEHFERIFVKQAR